MTAFRTQLWQHQHDAFVWAAPRRASLIAADMGTGKTAITLALLDAWNAQRVLITCPTSVLTTWKREVGTHIDDFWEVVLLDGARSVKERLEDAKVAFIRQEQRCKPCLLVINHEALWRPPFGPWAATQRWDAVVVDESHRAKSAGGKFSLYLSRLTRSARKVVALTGTPLPHSKLDLYAQARFLDHGATFGRALALFRARYCVMGGYQNHQIVGWQNIEEYDAKFASLAYRIRRQDALDLPDEMDVDRTFALEPSALRVYRELQNDLVTLVAQGLVTASNALVKLLRLQQVTSGHVPTDEGESVEISTGKRELLADILEDLDEPVVVFCRFRADLDAVRAVAEHLGREYGEVSGRRKDLDQGRMPAEIEVMGVQIQAGGLGIDLTRAAVSVFYSVGFSLGDYLQARARILRPGQTRKVTHVHLAARGTIDEVVLATLRKREEVIEAVLESLRGEHGSKQDGTSAGHPDPAPLQGSARAQG